METTRQEILDELLLTENPILKDVLATPSFVQAVKTGNPKLTEYLLSDTIFPQILDIALTDKCDGLTKKMISNVLSFLTTYSKDTQERIRNNPLFLKFITEFPNTKYATMPNIATNYSKIVETTIRKTNGEFIKDLPDLANFLINGMYYFAYEELFLVLTTEFMIPFGVNLDLIIEFAKTIHNEHGLGTAAIMKQMLKCKKDLYPFFDNPEVVSILLDEAIKPGNPLVSFETFQVIDKISNFSRNKLTREAIDSYYDKFAFNEHKDYVQAIAITVFKRFPDEYVNLLFEKSTLSTLSNAISKSLPFLDHEKLIDLNTKFNLVERILHTEICKTNPYIWTLAESLYGVSTLITPEFKQLHINSIDPHLKMRNCAYGGERPRDDSSDYAENESFEPFVSIDIAILSDSSSSDTSSDEENDIGGFENVKFFAKLAGMDELTESIETAQKVI